MKKEVIKKPLDSKNKTKIDKAAEAVEKKNEAKRGPRLSDMELDMLRHGMDIEL